MVPLDHLPVELEYVVKGHSLRGNDLLANMVECRVPEVEEP
jgi:hypothetical protein